MVNTHALASLQALIEEWIEENCDEVWWTEQVGYVTDGTSHRLATLVLLALEEARSSTNYDRK